MNAAKFQAVIDAICGGKALKKAIADIGVSVNTFYGYIAADPLSGQIYHRAQLARAEVLADEIIDIADTEDNYMKARNMIDARKWYTGKLNPAKFSDRLDITVTERVDIRGALDAAKSRVLPVRDQSNELIGEIIEETRGLVDAATDRTSVNEVDAAWIEQHDLLK